MSTTQSTLEFTSVLNNSFNNIQWCYVGILPSQSSSEVGLACVSSFPVQTASTLYRRHPFQTRIILLKKDFFSVHNSELRTGASAESSRREREKNFNVFLFIYDPTIWCCNIKRIVQYNSVPTMMTLCQST